MKFPRNARITKGSLEAAPWAAVMFLLIIFIMLGGLLYTPGVRVQLPEAGELPGTDRPTIRVAMDAAGGLYYQNQLVSDLTLVQELRKQTQQVTAEKPTLVIEADKQVSYDHLVHLTQLARKAGIEDALLATLPSPAQKIGSPVAQP
jgi:biopolymer transport protein ExbD